MDLVLDLDLDLVLAMVVSAFTMVVSGLVST